MKKILGIGLVMLIIAGVVYFLQRHANGIRVPKKGEPIFIQPFEDMPQKEIEYVYHSVGKYYPNVILMKAVTLPENAWYAPRARYKADSIIKWLAKRTGDTSVIIGLTSKDVSTIKGSTPDWGVMGLGYEPGRACVVSTFRLNKKNIDEQLCKLCLHELGHNMGLSHCNNRQCYMRDAEGHNTTDEETCFCIHCANILRSKGWKL